MLTVLGRARAMVTPQCLATAKAALMRCSLNKSGLQFSPGVEGINLGETGDGNALKPMDVVMTKEGQGLARSIE